MTNKKPNLPQDLIDFLRNKKRLRYDYALCQAGKIKLKNIHDLSIEDVYVDSEESPLSKDDPNAGKKGYYAVPAISLVAECQGYDPDGILVWVPDISMFGSWDCDHWDLLVFPNITWTQIAANPLPFINAQWQPHIVSCEFFAPWNIYEFTKGKPW